MKFEDEDDILDTWIQKIKDFIFRPFPLTLLLYFWNRTSKTLTDIKSMRETDSSFLLVNLEESSSIYLMGLYVTCYTC